MTTPGTEQRAASAPASFDQWAVVELFGHQRIAGRAREELLAGKAFLRVDVPAIAVSEWGQASEAFTRYYGAAAVYSLTPTTEEIARLAAAQLRAAPVTLYVPSIRQLPPGEDFDFDEDGE